MTQNFGYARASEDHEEAASGSVVAERYEVRRQIARGGVASIFDAEHLVTGAPVALKVLHLPGLGMKVAHSRLMREARVLGSLRHPNVLVIHDAGFCPKHGPFLALERVDGRSLDSFLAPRETLSVSDTVGMLAQIANALDVVHQSGVVHRDIKPANVLIAPGPTGEVAKLIDFGIAKVGADVPDASPDGEKLTKQDELLGTVEFMAPEQLMGHPSDTDARSDVYSLGVMAYECLTGTVPFTGTPLSVISKLASKTKAVSVGSARGDVPDALEAAIMKAISIDPRDRFASAGAFAEACSAAAGAVEPLGLLRAADVAGRRRFVRAPYVAPVRIVLADGTVDGRTADISEGGALIIGNAECAPNQPVKVKLPLPVGGRVVGVDAVTRWVKHQRNRRAFGVEFRDLSEDAAMEIATYVTYMSRTAAPSPTLD